VFGAVMTTGAAVLIYLTIEQGVRPVVHEASAALPADFAPPLRTVSLSAKLLGLLLTINVYSAMLMAAFSSTSLGREARLGLAVLLAFTFPLALSMLLRRSLTLRLHEFRRAFSRVREGDLEAQLPNLAGDELDEVGRSFNEMVAGLRERAQLQDDLQASRARIVAAADASRRAVERDLHDGAQQHLVLLKLQLGLVERTVAGHPQALESLSAAKGQLDRALAELRDLAHGIYPPALTNDGLAHALEEAGARCGISTTVRCDADRHPPEVEAAVYFCCVEALQNAAKHAGEGAAATVTVTDADGVLRFEVADDGCGFDRATANGSSGLQNMADRVGALGGALRIEAAPHRGTRVRGQVPL
jgi:signal transduction histidine kinase